MRPGTQVVSRETVTARSAPTNTGTAFIAGFVEEGFDTDVALGPFRNLAQVVEATGDRVSYGYVYDAADVFFREGGAECYVAPVVGSGATSGDDDHANADDTDWADALDLFTKDLGPGQVLAPGKTTAAVHGALADHAEENNRIALLDLADDADRADLETAATSAASGVSDPKNTRRAVPLAPWYEVPGVGGGTHRTVPPSAVVAGIVARNDAETGNPNLAAAGPQGLSRFALDVTQTYTDADREDLNDAGVNVGRNVRGQVQNYGWRTLADPDTDVQWVQASKARTHMAIIAEGEAIAERYVFSQIDGKGHKAAEFAGDLTGVLLGYYSLGALFGDTPEEAFTVDVGSDVNTPESIADGELRAVVAVRTSPFAELVTLEIVAVPVDESI